MQKFGTGLGILLVLAHGNFALADTVTLANGDKLQGKVLHEEGDRLVFKSSQFPLPLRIPLESVASIAETPVDAPEEEGVSSAENAPPAGQSEGAIEAAPPPEDPAPLPPETPAREAFELPENWDARLGLGFSDRQNESSENREISAQGRLAWKGVGNEAEWRGHYHYLSQEEEKAADRYGISQRLRHRGENGFYVQTQTKAEVDNVTKNRTQIAQTAGLGYSPIKEEKLTVNVTPGFKAEHVAAAERKDQKGTAYKAHVEQDLKWKVNDAISIGQGLSYSVDPRRSGNWDMDFKAFVETKVSEDVNLRVNYRRDFLNQTEGAADKESAELGASLVWNF